MVDWMMRNAYPNTKDPRSESLTADQFAILFHGGGSDYPRLKDIMGHIGKGEENGDGYANQVEPA